MLRILFCALLALHGAIHVLGFVKAFDLAELPQLRHPIGPAFGILWLTAAVGFVVGAVLFALSQRYWWMAVTPALLLSVVLVASSWTDAKFGLIPNLIVALPVALALLNLRSSSFQSAYTREVERLLEPATASPIITHSDLGKLPEPVRKYLRRAGIVGKPRVKNFGARFTEVLRSAPDAAWMPTRAEQHDFFGGRPARLFIAQALRNGIPFEVLHIYEGASASMKVRIGSLFDVVEVRGPEMTQSETVTLFNDMCLLAPATLVDASVEWKELDATHVHAIFANAGHTISALLSFDAQGDLTSFISNDRYQLDGKTKKRLPWVTPVSGYRDFGGVRLAAHGAAAWEAPEGRWEYARFELQAIEYNVRSENSVARVARSLRPPRAWTLAAKGTASLGH